MTRICVKTYGRAIRECRILVVTATVFAMAPRSKLERAGKNLCVEANLAVTLSPLYFAVITVDQTGGLRAVPVHQVICPVT